MWIRNHELVEAYRNWLIQETWNEWTPYLINIMFKPLRGQPFAVATQMHHAIENYFYSQLCKQVDRHPGRPGRRRYLPHVILFPDLPVLKYRRKSSLSDVRLNGGLHYNGFISISPRTRLKEDFVDHIRRYQSVYAGKTIQRIHVTPITHDANRVTDYTMKTVTRGKLDYDHVIILPKSLNETQSAVAQMDNRTSVIKQIQSATNLSDDTVETLYRLALPSA
jgi:hypothetical protein